MRIVKLNGKSTYIPESWADVTLQRYTAAAKAMREHSAHKEKAMGAAIAALLNINIPTLFSLDIDEVESLAKQLDFYFTTLPQPKPVSDFTIQGTIFKVPIDIVHQSFGEFADMDTLVTDHKEDLLEAVPGIVAIYCRPEGEKYNPDLTPSRTNLMQSLDIETAEGLAAFFLTNGQLSKATISRYGGLLVSLTYKVHLRRSSLKRMAGWRRLLHLPTMIFCAWMRSRIRKLGTS